MMNPGMKPRYESRNTSMQNSQNITWALNQNRYTGQPGTQCTQTKRRLRLMKTHLCLLQAAPGPILTQPLSPLGPNWHNSGQVTPEWHQSCTVLQCVCLQGLRSRKTPSPLCFAAVCAFFTENVMLRVQAGRWEDGVAGRNNWSDTDREAWWRGRRKQKRRVKCCSPPLRLIPRQSVLTVCSSASPSPLLSSPPFPTPYCVELGLHNPLQSEITQHTTTDDKLSCNKDSQHLHEPALDIHSMYYI